MFLAVQKIIKRDDIHKCGILVSDEDTYSTRKGFLRKNIVAVSFF